METVRSDRTEAICDLYAKAKEPKDGIATLAAAFSFAAVLASRAMEQSG